MTWYHHHFQPIRSESHACLACGDDEKACGVCNNTGKIYRRIVAEWSQLSTVAHNLNDGLGTLYEPPFRPRVLVGELFEPLNVVWRDVPGFTETLDPADIRASFFALADSCPGVDFILETRWPEMIAGAVDLQYITSRIDRPLDDARFVRDNVWLCCPVSTQADADRLLPLLLAAPAAKRVVRCRPKELLRFVDSRIDWCIVGDCTDPHIVYHIVTSCRAAGVPVWVEEWPGIPKDLDIQETP